MAAGQVGEGVIVIGADSRNFSKELHEQTSKASKSAGEESGNAFTEGVERVVKRGAQLAGVGIAATLAVGFSTAMDDEVAKMKFTQLFKGQVDKATGFIEELKVFAARTPFDFPGLQDAAGRFLSVGIEAKRIIPLMENLGNITSIMGSGAEGVKHATMALQQMAVAGRVTGGDMLQLLNANIPAWDLLADSMHKPVPELRDMMEKGLIPAEAMFKALENTSGKTMQTFVGGMEKMSQTTEGKLSTLKDNFSQFAARIVSGAIPVLNGFVTTLSDQVIPAVETGFNAFKGWITGIDFTPFLDVVRSAYDTVVTVGGKVIEFAKSPEVAAFMAGVSENVGLVKQYITDFVNDPTVQEFVKNLWDKAIAGIQGLASWIQEDLIPALITVGGWVRDVVNWFRDHENAVKALGATIGIVSTLIVAAWVAQGVVAVIEGAKSVLAWIATATASTTSATIQSKSTAQIVFGWVVAAAAAVLHGAVVIAQFVLMGVQATIHAAIVVAAWVGGWIALAAQAAVHAAIVAAVWIGSWVAQAAQAVISAAITAGAWVGAWVLMAAQAMIHAVAIAAAWLVAFWPIALIVAAVIGLAIVVITNLDTIKEWISNTWDTITSWTYNTWNSIYSFFENIWNNITSWVSEQLETLKGWINTAWEWLKGVTSAAWEAIKLLILGPIGVVMLLTGKNLDDLKGMISGAWDNITSWTSNAWNNVLSFISTALMNIKFAVSEKFNEVVGFFQGLPGRLVGALGDLGRLLFDKGKDVIQGLWDGMTEIWNKVTGWIGGIVSWIKEHKGPLSLDRELLKPAGSAIMKGFEEGLNSGKDPILKGLTNFTGAIGSIVGGRVKVGNEWLDTDTFAKISAALGSAWRLFQGSWSTRVAASFGTHAGSGVADLAPTGISFSAAEARLRAAGLAAWFRNWPGNLHIHLVNPAMAGLSAQAAAQVGAFFRGGSGLGYASGTRAATPGWGLVGERGPEWMRFRGGETVLPNGRSPGTTITVTMNVSVDDLDKMSKIGDFIDMIDRARLDNRRTARSGVVAA